jgi:hypothetical protein
MILNATAKTIISFFPPSGPATNSSNGLRLKAINSQS